MSTMSKRVADLSADKLRALAERLKARDGAAGTQRIRPVPRGDDPLPLSFTQERLWFLDRLEEGASSYEIPAAVRLAGLLAPGVLARAFEELERRHESLRTSFGEQGGQPFQRIAPAGETAFVLPLIDLSAIPGPRREVELLRGAVAGAAEQRFDLARGPLMRARLFRFGPEEHALVLSLHHIISDGWSMEVLVREVAGLYQALLQGRPSSLPVLPVQYADYAVWQRERLRGELLAQELSFWRERLTGIEPLALPTDRPRPARPSFRGAEQTLEVPGDTADLLRELARGAGTTLFVILTTAWQTLLARYTGQADIAVGSPVANRRLSETQGLIGFFANTVVLRTVLADDPEAGELLRRVREVVVDAFAHEELPFEKLVQELQPERDLGRNPLFQVMVSLHTPPLAGLESLGLRLAPFELPGTTAKFDLTLGWQEREERLSAALEYSTDLFDNDTAGRMLAHLGVLLRGLTEDPARRVSDLPLLTPAERRQLAEWNDTAAGFPAGLCLHGLFERQAERAPEAVALVAGDETLSFGELDRRSDRLAARLRSLGIGPESRVALCLERSPEALIALLAVLKAGGAYVPLDPEYPQGRLAFMLEDSGAGLLLTRERWAGRFVEAGVKVLCVDRDDCEGDSPAQRGPRTAAQPGNAAYVIYTSGSTGRPKGVVVPHRAAVNHGLAVAERYGLGSRDRVLQFASLSFDVSLEEVFPTWSQGGAVVLAAAGPAPAVEDLLNAARDSEVSVLNLPAAYWHEWVSELAGRALPWPASLRLVVTGSEAVRSEALRVWLERAGRGIVWFNAYGPTEAAVTATLYGPVDPAAGPAPGARVPIGRPIANTYVRLLDRHLRPVVVGVTGQIYLGGAGLARGYAGWPDLTAERFVPDSEPAEPGARLYRTGDLARRRPDGCLEFLGRVDHQVKLRGFRIELGEIEAALLRCPEVSEAVVVAREDAPGERSLVAYVVTTVSDPAVLRAELGRTLPSYMLPSGWVVLPELPRTPNGKVDRKALPAPGGTAPRTQEPVAPRSDLERSLAEVWAGVLRRDLPGVYDNFFDLGGHSLLAMQVISRIRESLGVELPVRTLFEAPTVAGLAAVINARLTERGGDAPVARIGRRADPYAPALLSFGQQRLWFLDRLDPGSAAYSMPAAFRLRGRLDPGALQHAFAEIVRRHEILRTTFSAMGGEPRQVIAPAMSAEVLLPLLDLTALPVQRRGDEALDLAAREARRPFDLAAGPLLRLLLARLEPAEHALLVTVHHIVSDGWSTDVLVRELATLYEAFSAGRPSPMPELPVQYADFAVWQRHQLSEERLSAGIAWWRERLAGMPEQLDLPVDRPRPMAPSGRGGTVDVHFGAEVAAGVRTFAGQRGATPFMVLLAAFQALLSRYTGRPDVVIGSPVAGRDRAELEGLIGFFVNTLALRTDLAGASDFGALVDVVRDGALQAFAHQEVPFERLVEEIVPDRQLGRMPLVQVLFNFVDRALPAGAVAGFDVEPMELRGGTAKFELTLSLGESEGGLEGFLEYSSDLFNAVTANRLAGHFATLLAGAVADPGRSIGELPLLSEAELRQLAAWNETVAPYPHGLGLHELFEAQATRTPEAPALIWGGERVSYRDLDRQAGRLAGRLRRLGVGPETLVGILSRRTPAMVAGLLATLKAGGAYLPLDPAYPRERLAFLRVDSGAPVVLAEEGLTGLLQGHGGAVIDLGDALDGGEEVSDRLVHPDQAAYAIYTSGSTGRPKGVVIRHAGAVARIAWAVSAYGPERLARTLAATSICFDLSVFEIFAPLAAGGAVVLADDALALPELPAAAEVTLVNTVPSAMAELVRSGQVPAGVRTVNLAGEPLRRELADRIHSLPGVEELWDLYGPSEDTTYSTGALVERSSGAEPSIGLPLPNSRAYVLDSGLGPAPVGVPGELWLGGDGLARGYLGRPDLTADRFRPDPFGGRGSRLYRTGDLARRRTSGELDFLGRIDHQVKVRGFRIELGEIEAALLRCPEVAEAVVVAREDAPGERSLVAYVVATTSDPAVLRAELGRTLPSYMLPSDWVVLPELPRTPNGKVDRKALPAPHGPASRTSRERIAPRSATEELLAGIWAGVLRHEGFGIHDDFFAVGGHSLLAVQVVSQLRERLGVEMPVRALFEMPTVAELATLVRLSERKGAAPLGRIERRPDPAAPALLSFGQQRLWFLDQLDPGSSAYNVPAAFLLKGRLDEAALRLALDEVTRRHETLRTTFLAPDGEPRALAAGPSAVPLPRVDLEALPATRRRPEAEAVARREASRPFDLAAGPLFRALLLRLAAEEHALLVTLHHIVSDGWSMDVLMREVTELYEAFRTGRPSPFPELPVQYADFALWQRGRLAGEGLEAEVAWWRERLAGAPDQLDLPMDRPRPATASGRGGVESFHLPAVVATGIRSLARQQGATSFMVLLAAFQALLARCTGQSDVVTGSPVAGRDRAELEGLIGFFVNTLVLRTDLSGVSGFGELLVRVRESTLEVFAHQEVPFDRLVEALQPDRLLGRASFVQVMLSFFHHPALRRATGDLEVTSLALHTGTAKVELALSLTDLGSGVAGDLEYSEDLFDAPTVRRLAGHFETLLTGALAELGRPLADLPLLSPAELRQLADWSEAAPAQTPVCLHRIFEIQAALTPDAVAVDIGDEALTYGELNVRANRLAYRLRRLGVGAEQLVGLCLERSIELILGLLGILKAGAAYLPLDPSYPRERLFYMLTDSGAQALLTRTGLVTGPDGLAGTLALGGPMLLPLDAEWESIAREPGEDLDLPVSPESPAYVIYTSGSTGRPKGVAVPHRGLANLAAEEVRLFAVGPRDRVLQFSSIGFDASVLEILVALRAGGRLCLAPQEVMPGTELLDLLRERQVTAMFLAPSALGVLPAAELPALRTLIVGGEACPVETAERWRACRLVNAYGPTEATVFASASLYRPGEGKMTLGRPIAGAEVHVLDRSLRPVPVGVAGEILIGGVGLSRGYLGRSELTAERFVPHPSSRHAGARLYRTGDLARWLPDGRLEFLGRIDHQVKIRGFRIELGEVEAALRRHPELADVVVLAREDKPGERLLVAYVVPAGSPSPVPAELKAFLRETLPPYMVPVAFVALPSLPVTASGKVDRRALPAPDSTGAGQEYVPPRSELEEALAAIWADVLRVERVGAFDNFFDLGGHSLKATQAVAQIRQLLQVDLPVRTLFEAPTLAELSVAVVQRVAEQAEDEDFFEVLRGVS